MGIINFQKLKQKVKGAGDARSSRSIKNKDAVNVVEGNIKKTPKKSSLKHNLQHKNKVNAGEVNAGKANAGIRADVSRDFGLLESRYCYGCDQFCVDYPFTDKEQAWCVRPVLDDNGKETSGYHMVRIRPKHKVWQCPKLKGK